MAVKPILFRTEMVRAILDKRKTVTRRVMKPQPLFYTGRWYVFADDVCPKEWEDCDDIISTYQYQPGDILYVRETWERFYCCNCEGDETGQCFNYPPDSHEGCYVYRSSHNINGDARWHPSIHMPREAARIFLRVTDVRVERLWDITEDEARKEGAQPVMVSTDPQDTPNNERTWHEWFPALPHFIEIWDRTIKPSDCEKYGWASNPWVWVIEFEQISKEG